MANTMLSSGKTDFDVLVIGAGISGINMGYRLQERNPDLSYAILEGRHEIGGTWSLFKFPGIRSDSDLFTFGFPWRPWRQESPIAKGELIIDYVKESAAEYGIDKKILFQHHVQTAKYSSTDKTWTLAVTADGQPKVFRCRFMMLCTGYYDYTTPLQTVIPGIENFEGVVAHPQFWPEELDYTGKDVVIVGSGATTITVVPAMAEKASHVTMLQRSPSYVMPIPTEDGIDRTIKSLFWWSQGMKDFFFRLKWILLPLFMSRYAHYFPEAARKTVYQVMQKQLPSQVPRDPHFSPRYTPWKQRMCMSPDGDFFQSLRDGKASVVTDTIENITAKTIKLTSGQELHPDIIVTATGLKLRFAGGIEIFVDEKPLDVPSKFVWNNVMLEDLPNAGFIIGYVDASWTLAADSASQMLCRILKKMKNEGAVEIIPRRSDDDKKNMQELSFLRLTSTYVTKAKDIIPKAGDRGPWQPRTNYLRDITTAWFGDIKTGAEWVRGV